MPRSTNSWRCSRDRDHDSVFLDGQSWGYGGSVDIARHNPWNVLGRYGWVGGTGTSTYVVPDDGSIAILLTQAELGGPGGDEVLESFWTAAATQLGHVASRWLFAIPHLVPDCGSAIVAGACPACARPLVWRVDTTAPPEGGRLASPRRARAAAPVARCMATSATLEPRSTCRRVSGTAEATAKDAA